MARFSRHTHNRWVAEQWWRDWLFWASAGLASAGTVVELVRTGSFGTDEVRAFVGTAIVSVTVLGFGREAVRGYRGTDDRG